MTAKRKDNHSTEFGLWLREQSEIDSGLGYLATNLDFIWRNYKTGYWLMIEEKRYRAVMKRWQKDIFRMLHEAAKNDKNYKGFYLIQFEKTSPEDGAIWINNKESSKRELLDLLTFKKF